MKEGRKSGGDRLARQIDFIIEVDRLKGVLRQTLVMDGSRRENSAEHSWHLALMALVLQEYADEAVDVDRVLRMLLVHDLVEIHAGDTFCYDEEGNAGKLERERLAADQLFGALETDLERGFRELWEEFETRQTAEARFAAALDRMQPLLANLATGGHSWKQHGVDHSQVVERTRSIGDSSRRLWDYMRSRLEEAVDQGLLER